MTIQTTPAGCQYDNIAATHWLRTSYQASRASTENIVLGIGYVMANKIGLVPALLSLMLQQDTELDSLQMFLDWVLSLLYRTFTLI